MIRDSKSIIGNNLKRIREKRRQTQLEFSSAIGISQNFLCEIEKGKSGLSMDRLFIVAQKLGLPVSDLCQEKKRKPGRCAKVNIN